MTAFETYWRTNKPKTCDLVDSGELRALIEFAFNAGVEVGVENEHQRIEDEKFST